MVLHLEQSIAVFELQEDARTYPTSGDGIFTSNSSMSYLSDLFRVNKDSINSALKSSSGAPLLAIGSIAKVLKRRVPLQLSLYPY